MSIELLKSGYEEFLRPPQVLKNHPHTIMITHIVGYLLAKECTNAKPPAKPKQVLKPPAKPKQVLPEGYIHIYEFEQGSLICSASWLRRWIKQTKNQNATKFKGQVYVHPQRIVDDLAKCTRTFPKVARKAKFYLKNNSAK